MRKTQLLSTVAAALLLTVGAASAQGLKGDEQPGRAPAAQQNAPAEKVSPPMHHGQSKSKGAETTGQGAPEIQPGEPGTKSHSEERGRDQMKPHSEEHRGNGMKSRTEERREGASPSSRSSESTSERSRTTTGQGSAAGAAKLSTEQRSKITTIIRQHKVEPTRLDMAVRVGTRVPDSVRFYPLPTQVVEIYPEWRGYDYILVGEQIVVVDPGTHEIVAILEA